MTKDNPPPKDVFIAEALSELEKLVANNPEIALFQTSLREYLASTLFFTELPPGDYPSPLPPSSAAADPQEDPLFRLKRLKKNNGKLKEKDPHPQDYLPVDRSIEDTVMVDQKQDWHDRIQGWRKVSNWTAAAGFVAGAVTMGLEYFLHGSLTPMSTAVTGCYVGIGGVSLITANRLEARLSQLKYDGLPALMRDMTTGNRFKRWIVRNMVTGVNTLTGIVLALTLGGIHTYSEYVHHSAGSKETTIEQKVEEDSSLPRPQLIFDTPADTYEVNSGAVMKAIDNPQTNTRKLLAPYEEKMEGLENINIEPLHDQLAWRERAIREACQEARFDNPDLITVMYHTFIPPRVFDPIPWGQVKRFEPVLSGEVPIEELDENEKEAYLAFQANNNQFKDWVKEKYLSPLLENLKRTEKRYGRVNILESLGSLVYTDKQLETARKQLKRREGTTDEEELNILLYLGGQLPKEGKREELLDLFMSEKEDTFIVPAVLHSYFALQHHHQMLRNRREQHDNQTGKRIYRPKNVPVLNVTALVNDPMQKKKGQPDPCPARYSPQNVQFSISNRWNAVRPGESVLVRYGVAVPGVRVESQYGMDQLLDIPDLFMWAEGVDSSGQISIPKHAVPGTYPVKFSTGLSDGCRLDLETTMTVTNEVIPER